jgi:amino acid adenylation domain-containing protein
VKPDTELADEHRVKTISSGAGRMLVPQLVEQQCQDRPESIAVSGSGATLTYAALDRAANQLAHQLRWLGVGTESLVGIYMERSPASVIAALACFKAGGAYLPLDPALPAERLLFMLNDANVTAVVCDPALSRDLPPGPWQVVSYDPTQPERSAGIARRLDVEVRPEHLAYVIYTSGSTGKPKGVEITHGNLSNLVAWHVRAFGVTAVDRASLQAAIGFDATVWELWPYLATGASVAIPDAEVRNHPEMLRDWLVANKITIMFLPTAMAEQMLLLNWPKQTALRTLLTGADVLRRRPAHGLPFRLVNNYGPTECTVVATSGEVLPDAQAIRSPSIGSAIDGTEIHLLDEKMRPVKNGKAGEIYIGGENVGRGYRNNATLTAERFVSSAAAGNGRLYRTGDLGRFLPNGEVEFLGRADGQMKIRGFRVEPEEIVAAMNAHAGVRASAVQLQGENEEKKLIAYVALTPGASVSADELRQSLNQMLPDYMVPAVFVKIAALPLNLNDKVDYAALPAPTAANTLREVQYVAPRTLVEQRLAAILSPLLRVERVSVKDNFFLLGGHSLLGTQLLTKIREVFGVELSLLGLFDHPTLEGMSVEVENLIIAKMSGGNGANGSMSMPSRAAAERRR